MGGRHNAEDVLTADQAASPFIVPKEYLCPSDEISRNINNAVSATGTVSVSYGYNCTEFIRQYQFFSNGPPAYTTNPAGHRAMSIKRASDKLAFTDSIDWWVAWGGADYRIGWDVLHQASIQSYKSSVPRVDGPTIYRHNEGANVVFYDGHTLYMKKQDMFVVNDYVNCPKNPGMWVVDMGLFLSGQLHCP
jgi:prepilin-type processing-associated H-X9-DG protein